jgi:hypothetical protein
MMIRIATQGKTSQGTQEVILNLTAASAVAFKQRYPNILIYAILYYTILYTCQARIKKKKKPVSSVLIYVNSKRSRVLDSFAALSRFLEMSSSRKPPAPSLSVLELWPLTGEYCAWLSLTHWPPRSPSLSSSGLTAFPSPFSQTISFDSVPFFFLMAFFSWSSWLRFEVIFVDFKLLPDKSISCLSYFAN